jgi:hypothetical protein
MRLRNTFGSPRVLRFRSFVLHGVMVSCEGSHVFPPLQDLDAAEEHLVFHSPSMNPNLHPHDRSPISACMGLDGGRGWGLGPLLSSVPSPWCRGTSLVPGGDRSGPWFFPCGGGEWASSCHTHSGPWCGGWCGHGGKGGLFWTFVVHHLWPTIPPCRIRCGLIGMGLASLQVSLRFNLNRYMRGCRAFLMASLPRVFCPFFEPAFLPAEHGIQGFSP